MTQSAARSLSDGPQLSDETAGSPTPTTAPAAATAGRGIVIDGVTRVFGTGWRRTTALEDIHLEVPRGSFVSVIGPSGCGKSTLLRIAAGLIDANEGNVTILGRPTSDAVADKAIGFVPQAPALLPWRSVLDNVRLPMQINRAADGRGNRTPRDPVEVLRRFGLGTVLDAPPSELSGGMQQRVAIARALVFDPAVLLMDEPFSALDELTREAQRHELLRIWQADRKTVLLVTHSIPEAVLLSDTVAVMSAGPGRIEAMIPVDLPRPRNAATEASEEFLHITNKVRDELYRAWGDHE